MSRKKCDPDKNSVVYKDPSKASLNKLLNRQAVEAPPQPTCVLDTCHHTVPNAISGNAGQIVVRNNAVPPMTINIGGNTAGSSKPAYQGSLLLYAGSNITLSASTSPAGETVSIIGASGGGGGGGSLSFSAGTSSAVLGSLVFSNSNGFAFGLNGSTVTGSYTVPTQSTQTQNLFDLTLAGNTSGALALVSSGTMTLAGGNNITLSQAGNAITIFGPSTSSQTVQTQNCVDLSLSGNTSGALALISSGTAILAGGNNITLSQNGNSVTILGPNTSASTETPFALSAGSQSVSTGTVSFADSNGISFGMAGSSRITASYTVPSQSTQTQNLFDLTLSGNTSGALALVSSGTLTLAGGNNITLSQAGNAITISGPNTSSQTVQTQNLVDVTLSGNTSGTLTLVSSGTLTLAGGNNITLSQVGNAVTISGPNTAAETPFALSAGSQSVSTGTISFGDSNGITFGMSGSSLVTASYTVPTVTNSSWTVSDAVTSLTISRLAFTNSNGLTLSLSTGAGAATVIGSYTVPTQSTQTQNLFDLTLAGNTSGTLALVSSGTLTLAGGNNITLSQSGNAVTISGPNTAAETPFGMSAGTQSVSTGTVSFANSNGISFGMSGSNQITASYTVPTVTNSSWTVSDAATSLTISRLAFTNSNGLTLSLSTGAGAATVIGSYTVPTVTNSSWTVSDNATSLTISRLAFTQSNGLTLSLSTAAGAATVIGSYTVPTVTAGSDTAGMSNIGNTSGTTGVISGDQIRLILAGGNNITLSQSINGSSATITISAFTQSVESQSFGMSNIGNTSGTTGIASGAQVRFVLAGDNNITLSQSINGASGTISISAFTQSVESQTLGMSNIGNTSGTTGVVSAGQIRYLFAGGNNVTLSQSLNGASGTVTISAAAQTVESQSLGMSNLGNTSGTTGIASGGQVRMLFAGGNNVTLSQSLNGASGTITISAGGPWTASDSATSLTIQQLMFSNANAISLGLATTTGGSATLTASYDAMSVGMSNVGNTAGDIFFASRLFILAGGSNITLSQVSTTGGRVTCSIIGPSPSAAAVTFGVSTGGNTTGTTGTYNQQYIFAGGNNITLSQSTNGGSGTVTIVGIGQAVSASNGSFSFQTLTVADSNGISFSTGTQGLYAQGPVASQFPLSVGAALAASISSGITAGGGTQTSVCGFIANYFVPYMVSYNEIRWPMAVSAITTVSNQNWSYTGGVTVGLYTKNAANLSLVESWSNKMLFTYASAANSTNASATFQMSYGGSDTNGTSAITLSTNVGNAGGFWSAITGTGNKYIPLRTGTSASVLNPGQYYVVAAISFSTGGSALGDFLRSQLFLTSLFEGAVLKGPIGFSASSANLTNEIPFVGPTVITMNSNTTWPLTIGTNTISSTAATSNPANFSSVPYIYFHYKTT